MTTPDRTPRPRRGLPPAGDSAGTRLAAESGPAWSPAATPSATWSAPSDPARPTTSTGPTDSAGTPYGDSPTEPPHRSWAYGHPGGAPLGHRFRPPAQIAAWAPQGGDPGIDRPWYGIGPWHAIGRAFRKYATFKGRASRGEYWWFFLANTLVATVLLGAFLALGGWDAMTTGRQEGEPWHGVLLSLQAAGLGDAAGVLTAAGVWAVAVALPALTVTCRRLHDVCRSGFMCLVLLLPPPPLGLAVLLGPLASRTVSWRDPHERLTKGAATVYSPTVPDPLTWL